MTALTSIVEGDFSPAIGGPCGHRLYVVAREGRRFVTLLSPSSLTAIRVPNGRFAELADLPRTPCKASRLAALIRRNVRVAEARREPDQPPVRLPRADIAAALRKLRGNKTA